MISGLKQKVFVFFVNILYCQSSSGQPKYLAAQILTFQQGGLSLNKVPLHIFHSHTLEEQ